MARIKGSIRCGLEAQVSTKTTMISTPRSASAAALNPRANLLARLARCESALSEAEQAEEQARSPEANDSRSPQPASSCSYRTSRSGYASPKADTQRLQLALAEHNLVRAETELRQAVQRHERGVRDLGSDEAAAYKHCAVLLLRSVASARLESAMRATLSEWRAAVWAIVALRAASRQRRPMLVPPQRGAVAGGSESPAQLLVHATLVRVRASRLAWAMGRWVQGVGAAAAAATVEAVVAEAKDNATSAAAGRRQAAQQAKWAMVAMHQQNTLARRAALHKLVLEKWQHRDVMRAWEKWLLFDARPAALTAAQRRNVQEGKWALQALHVERVAAATQRRGWAASRLLGVLTKSDIGHVGAAFQVWVHVCA